MMKIGLFDSGIGGTTILESVKQILPQAEYHYIADSKNCPYGEKSDEELEAIVSKNVEALRDWGADLFVIACNTATTSCLSFLRDGWSKEINDVPGAHSSCICPNIYFWYHLNSACMRGIPCLSVLKGY